MRKKYRVKRNEEIESIIKNHKSYGNKYFNVYIKQSETTYFRYAISVGKKIGIAVTRVKRKRQLRSIIDNMIDINQSLDILVVAKPTINDLEFDEMRRQLAYLFKKLNIKMKMKD
ncbi:MAG: ribonuclease P protein component [Acholeplasmatales bacterium]|nr:ribonuclease P protein component [Acholeplasmatales bacterium]